MRSCGYKFVPNFSATKARRILNGEDGCTGETISTHDTKKDNLVEDEKKVIKGKCETDSKVRLFIFNQGPVVQKLISLTLG